MTKRTIYIVIDLSASMRGLRASALNIAMKEIIDEVIPEVLMSADANYSPSIAVLGFCAPSRDAEADITWIIPKTKMRELEAAWEALDDSAFNGGTPTGEAIKAVVDSINSNNYGEFDNDEVPPAILLISDGEPNCGAPTYSEAIKKYDKGGSDYCPNYAHANRIAIGIDVAEEGRESLKQFGRLSRSLAQSFSAYYDCTDTDTAALIEVIKSCTLGLSTTV